MMTDQSSYVRGKPLKTMIGVEGNRPSTVPVEQIIGGDKRRPLNDAKVRDFMESIHAVGLLNPLVVALRMGEEGKEEYHLVAGRHRLQALKLLGILDARCTVLGSGDALRVELAAIDDNFIRNDPSPAEHALLTARRREIILALAAQDGTLSQDETTSRQAKRRAGEKTGHDVASTRDQANKTGEDRNKIYRSTKRFESLGPTILESIVGTSLDTGVELDALIKLPNVERNDLAKRAADGMAVSAKEALRNAKRESRHQSPMSDLEQASREFDAWANKYTELLRSLGLIPQIAELEEAFYAALNPGNEEDAPERTSERPKKRKWYGRFRVRKGD
jgi:ParB family transcriptional regulator, chromosome partitioning protein